MTTELPDNNLPDDATEDTVRPSLIQPVEVGDAALEVNHETLPLKGSAPKTADEINRRPSSVLRVTSTASILLKSKLHGFVRNRPAPDVTEALATVAGNPEQDSMRRTSSMPIFQWVKIFLP